MFKIVLIALTFSSLANAQTTTEKYSSTARDSTGSIVYQEQHEVIFKDGRIDSAKTRYTDSKGSLIGEMNSDFSKNVTVPEYNYKDLRNDTSHGINLQDSKMTLWSKDSKGKTESIDFFKNKFPLETLLVGCQGLHYYLVANLDDVRMKKSIPIAYFIPGRLDYYKFTLNLDREDEKFIYLKLSIDNFFLKMFTSSLNLKYDKSNRRLVQFNGLSNITNEKNQLQNVIIDFNYE